MNRIGKWHNIEKVLPVPTRTVLLDLGDDEYIVSRLYSVGESDGKIIFCTDGGHDPKVTEAGDVVKWAYIKLDEH